MSLLAEPPMPEATGGLRDFSPARVPGLRVVDPLAVPHWDAWVARYPDATVFHSQGWARVLAETYGHKPLYLTRVVADELVALLPLMELDSWLTGRRAVSLPFTDLCPPLGRAEDIQILLRRALALGRERAWKYLELRGVPARCFPVEAAGTFLGHTLDLTGGEDQLLRGFESGVRRAIRKAEASGVEVAIASAPSPVEAYYRLHCLTRQRQGVPPQPFRFFARLQRCVLEPGHGFVALARHQGRPVAGAVFLHFGTHAVYKYGASDFRHQELRANNLVMWRGIRASRERGCRTLHFGRTSRHQEGLRRYKLGFGATEETVDYFRLNPRTGTCVSVREHPRAWVNRLFGCLPCRPARWLGAALYPHAS